MYPSSKPATSALPRFFCRFAGLLFLAWGVTSCVSPYENESAAEAAPKTDMGLLDPLSTSSYFPNCGGSTTDTTPVVLKWGFPGSRTFIHGAPLTIQNNTEIEQTVSATIRIKGAGPVIESVLEKVQLRPGEYRNISIQTDAVDRLAALSHTPFTLVVFAEADGQIVWAEKRFFHRLDGSDQYLWYPASELAEHSRTLIGRILSSQQIDLSKQEEDLVGTMQFVPADRASRVRPSVWREATRLGLSSDTLRDSSGPSGPATPGGVGNPPTNSQTLCFSLSTDYSPGGVTFANTDSIKPARGARVWLSVPFVGTFFGITSRSNGCVNIPAIPTDAFFFAGMYFESHVGGNEARDIRIRAFDRPGSPWRRANWNGSSADVPRNAYLVQSAGAGSITELATHPDNWRMANMLAIGSELLAFYDQAFADDGAFTHHVDFEIGGCTWGEEVSCAWYDEGHITDYDGGPHKAELLGHEFGHIVDSMYMSAHLEGDYGINDATPGCLGYGEAHALNSKEHQSGAALEGLASALGAHALSSSSSWRYYKSIADSDGLYDNQIIDLEDADEFEYLNRVCACPPADCTSIFGVESDWIRFYWDWWGASAMPMSTFFQRHQNAASVAGLGDVYIQLRLQMPVGPERTLFEQRANLHGIDGIP